jgi:hypothetical protein
MTLNTRALTLAGVAGGGFAAVLSSTPCLGALNCIACMWLWLGGGLAAWLYPRFLKGEATRVGSLTAAEGAVVGATAGVFGALIHVGMQAVLQRSPEQVMRIMEQVGREMLPEQRQIVMALLGLMASGAGLIILLLISLFVYVVFCSLGGAVAAALTHTQPLSAAAPAPPPGPAPVRAAPGQADAAADEPPAQSAPPQPPDVT